MKPISRIPMYLGMAASVSAAGLISIRIRDSWVFSLVFSACATIIIMDRVEVWLNKRKELKRKIYGGDTND